MHRSSFHAALEEAEEKVIAEMLCIMCLIMDVNFVVFCRSDVTQLAERFWWQFLLFLYLQIFHVKTNLQEEEKKS